MARKLVDVELNMSIPPASGPAHPRLAMIVARAKNGVIGRDGGMPWRLKAELQHFKKTTMGKPILMGRKTWESLPKLLPGRPHFVLSRDPRYVAEGGLAFNDLSAMLARGAEVAAAAGVDEFMIIGGESLYALAFARAERLYLTEVDAEIEGDARFPDFDETEWREVEAVRHEADTDNAHSFTIRVLDRVRNQAPRPA
jgi:dihydrofolate reductase